MFTGGTIWSLTQGHVSKNLGILGALIGPKVSSFLHAHDTPMCLYVLQNFGKWCSNGPMASGCTWLSSLGFDTELGLFVMGN